MIDVLARPIVELLGAFGDGTLPAGGPADVMRASSAAIETAQGLGRVAIGELAADWSGPAADAAVRHAESAHASALALADHADEIAAVVDQACRDTQQGFLELQAIASSFVGVALSAGPMLATPVGQTMLITAAIDHLERALVVVARVRAELAAHTAAVTGYAAPPSVPDPAGIGAAGPAQAPSAPTAGKPLDSPLVEQLFGAGEKLVGSVGQALETHLTDTGVKNDQRTGAAHDYLGEFGTAQGDAEYSTPSVAGGVEVTLPDGTVATAPNAEAAGAVRNALTQQGVPYSWGGTEPGRGLDCSGLTRWAYAEQGVELPRLAQEQNIGRPVAAHEVMAGDLAVWDGHVAMAIGNGQLVEPNSHKGYQ